MKSPAGMPVRGCPLIGNSLILFFRAPFTPGSGNFRIDFAHGRFVQTLGLHFPSQVGNGHGEVSQQFLGWRV